MERSNQTDEEGNRLLLILTVVVSLDWLSMMYSRLRLAKNLLSEDGLIFISIGEQELDNLSKVSKEIFGEGNYISIFLRQRKKKPSFLHSNIGSMFEYIVCLSINKSQTEAFSVEETTVGKKYPLNNAGNSLGILSFPPNSVTFSSKDNSYEPQNMSEGNIVTKLLDRVVVDNHQNKNTFRLEGEFRYSQTRLNEIIANKEQITISKPPFRPNHIKSGGEPKKMHNLLTPETYNIGTNEDGTSELEQLFGKSVFDNPKPTSLISPIIKAISGNDNCFTVRLLFWFCNNCPRVMQLNAEDGGNRKFIRCSCLRNAIQN